MSLIDKWGGGGGGVINFVGYVCYLGFLICVFVVSSGWDDYTRGVCGAYGGSKYNTLSLILAICGNRIFSSKTSKESFLKWILKWVEMASLKSLIAREAIVSGVVFESFLA